MRSVTQKFICIVLSMAFIVGFVPLAKPEFGVTAASGFSDVTNPDDFWYKPVYWAADNKITTGYSDGTFKPGNTCTRAQMVTFIWRMAGRPEPKKYTNPFSDVYSSDYWYKAALWGNENGIVEGYKDGTFGPQIVCARKHAVTFLWRLAGKPEPKSKKCKFSDVNKSDYFYKPVIWANENKILAGYDDGTFRAGGDCLRRQIVTFLWKFDNYGVPIVTPTPIPTNTPTPTPGVYSLDGLTAQQILDKLLPLAEVSTGDRVEDYPKRFPVKPVKEDSGISVFYYPKSPENYVHTVGTGSLREEMDGTWTVLYNSFIDINLKLDSYEVASEFYDIAYEYLCQNADSDNFTGYYSDNRTGTYWDSSAPDYCSVIQMNRRKSYYSDKYLYEIRLDLPVKNRPAYVKNSQEVQ